MTTTLSYTPAKVNLKIKQGDKWTETWPLKRRDDTDPDNPVTTVWDLTGCSVVGQVRDGPADDFTEVLAEIDCEIVDHAGGEVRTTLIGEQTVALPEDCYWEWTVVDPDDEEKTIMGGTLSVQREVQRRA